MYLKYRLSNLRKNTSHWIQSDFSNALDQLLSFFLRGQFMELTDQKTPTELAHQSEIRRSESINR